MSAARAVRGDWWVSKSGAVYLVLGTAIHPDGGGSGVRCLWITGHVPPQIQRVTLWFRAWRMMTMKGLRCLTPPKVNAKGADIASKTDEALRMLEEG